MQASGVVDTSVVFGACSGGGGGRYQEQFYQYVMVLFHILEYRVAGTGGWPVLLYTLDWRYSPDCDEPCSLFLSLWHTRGDYMCTKTRSYGGSVTSMLPRFLLCYLLYKKQIKMGDGRFAGSPRCSQHRHIRLASTVCRLR